MTNNVIDSEHKDKADYLALWDRMALAQVPQELLPYGELEVVNVFIYYDGPKLFSLYSKEKNVYLLVLWAHEDEDNDSHTSLYLPLSEKNYLLATTGEVNLYSAFSLAEDGNVLAVTTSYDGKEAIYSIEETNYSDISDDWLPTREAFLGKPKG